MLEKSLTKKIIQYAVNNDIIPWEKCDDIDINKVETKLA